MSDTAAQLQVLRDMHAKGVTALEQGGEKVSFASGAELRRRIAFLEAQLAAETTGQTPCGISYPAFDKGF